MELTKELEGSRPEDNWIRLFNAESREDLDMIKTMNLGIMEAIEEVKKMSMRSWVRAHYEANLKAKRDRKAREAYVWDEGHEEGRTQLIMKMLQKGMSCEEISQVTEISLEEIQKINSKLQ